MDKYKEDQLRILTNLNTFGFRPLTEIEEEGKGNYEDVHQFRIIFSRLTKAGLAEQDKGQYVKTIPPGNWLYYYYWGISQEGKIRLQELKAEKANEETSIKFNQGISIWTKIAAVAGIVAAIAAIYGIWLAYHPPH
jgi:hypothetical protein